MNPDDYITGLHDSNSPMNQNELPTEEEKVSGIKEAFESGHEHLFYEALSRHILELEKIRDYLRADSGIGIILTKKLNKIIETL